MTEHTKGKLYFYPIDDYKNDRGKWENTDGLGYIRTDSDNLEICHHGDTGRSKKENLANAQRIVHIWNCHDELLGILEDMEKIKDLWLPGNVDEEHVGEAQALHTMRDRILKALTKAKSIEV